MIMSLLLCVVMGFSPRRSSLPPKDFLLLLMFELSPCWRGSPDEPLWSFLQCLTLEKESWGQHVGPEASLEEAGPLPSLSGRIQPRPAVGPLAPGHLSEPRVSP